MVIRAPETLQMALSVIDSRSLQSNHSPKNPKAIKSWIFIKPQPFAFSKGNQNEIRNQKQTAKCNTMATFKKLRRASKEDIFGLVFIAFLELAS